MTSQRWLRSPRTPLVADQIEIKEATGARRVVPAHGVELVLGSGPDADIRVAATGVEGRHLRFVRSAKGVRVEAVRAGATVAINGQQLLCKDLQRGDVMKVAEVVRDLWRRERDRGLSAGE